MAFIKTLCLDFDGVCNTYTGWKGEDELFSPRPHLNDFISTIKSEYGVGKVVIHSTRPALKIREWLTKFEIQGVDEVVDRKPPAWAYLDDRAVQFTGMFEDALNNLKNFKVYWENK